MSNAGKKILAGIEDAIKGNFIRVTMLGQTWVKLEDQPTSLEGCIRAIVRDEMIKCRMLKDCSDDI